MNFEVRSPFSKQIVCTREFAEEQVWRKALEQAHAAFQLWRKVDLAQRIAEVTQALRYFKDRQEALARETTLQMGKPLTEARGEINTLLARSEYLTTHAEGFLRSEILPAKDGFERRIDLEPLGVILEIAPWNYPWLIPGNVVVTSLLAGNAVLLKHSELTPLVGEHFQQAFAHLSVPGLVQALDLSHEAVARLMTDDRVQSVVFTGSVRGGRQVYQQAAARLLPATLELGGKDPAYVAEDANLNFAAENIVDGACYNAGQSCCAVERAYLHRSVVDEFIRLAAKVMHGYRMGDPLMESTNLGPIANPKNLTLLEEHVADALNLGARLICGGKRWPDAKGAFFEPTLLADVPQRARIMQEESFGPVLPVHAVTSDEEAVARMNDSEYGLTASVWTTSTDRANTIAGNLQVGTVFQNRCDYLDPALPWSGVKQSGIGASLSRWGFYQVTRRKSIHFRTRT